MTEPKPEAKRWSSPDSDVDPVLRSVLRYGRELKPTSAQLGAIVAGAAERARTVPTRRKPRALWSIAAVAAVFVTGAAFAGYAVSQRAVPTPTPAASTPPRSKPASTPRNVTNPPAAQEAEAPPPQAVTAPDTAAPPTPPTRSVAPTAIDSAPQVDAARDAQLLQEARSLMARSPARALSLTRNHELHFPSSPLTEERQALQIEALTRLGRTAEARVALEGFRTRFPRSIHARRLEALGLP
jgi:type IV secretory pathway VirB10-like protein